MARYVDLDKIIDHLHDEWGYEGMEEELYDDLQIPVENVIAWTPISKELPPIGVPLLVTVDRKIAEGPPQGGARPGLQNAGDDGRRNRVLRIRQL